jgi:hypothetical protein
LIPYWDNWSLHITKEIDVLRNPEEQSTRVDVVAVALISDDLVMQSKRQQ